LYNVSLFQMEYNLCHRTTIRYLFKKKTVRFLYPSTYTLYNIKALASCTTSVYVNLSKNSSFNAPHPFFARKRMQRYDYF